MYVAYFSTFDSLQLARQAYYDRYRFGDVFVSLKRAPARTADALAAIPGVAHVAARIVTDVTLDIPGVIEPASGRLISIPAREAPMLNEPFVRSGRRPEREDEILPSDQRAPPRSPDRGAGPVTRVHLCDPSRRAGPRR